MAYLGYLMDRKPSLKAVLVGCGGISQAWLKPLQEISEVKIVGLVDLVEENARQRAVEFELTEAQIRYAATDAWICLMIYNRLRTSIQHPHE